MDIREAKQQVKTTIKAYLARDSTGLFRIPPAQQRPLFLIGAPGIGKTAIMGQVAEELDIGLVSYSMTHHTRQSALGLPFIVHKTYRNGAEFDISEYTMSEIIASIYDFMEESGKDEGILFLDEINCVSETLYPSMLQFLQFKTFGRHRVPDGWVVACAGNPPEYNRSVHEFDIVTMDRLRKIQVEPSFDAWRAFAREGHVHPAVLTYLDVRPDDFYLVESTPEGNQFVSARSWSELSQLIVLLEELGEPVDQSVIDQYVQHPEIARRFAAYYDLFKKYQADYQVGAILRGTVPGDVSQRARAAAFDERLALLALLLDSVEGDMRSVLERTGALELVRDELREIKGMDAVLADGRVACDSMITASVRMKNESQRLAGNPAAIDQMRREALAADVLRELAMQGSYDAAAEAYGGLVASLEDDADAICAQLDCAYRFIDEVFGMGGEALVFTTELSARSATVQFIANFGSDSFYAHSEKLSTDASQDAIFAEIDALR